MRFVSSLPFHLTHLYQATKYSEQCACTHRTSGKDPCYDDFGNIYRYKIQGKSMRSVFQQNKWQPATTLKSQTLETEDRGRRLRIEYAISCKLEGRSTSTIDGTAWMQLHGRCMVCITMVSRTSTWLLNSQGQCSLYRSGAS